MVCEFFKFDVEFCVKVCVEKIEECCICYDGWVYVLGQMVMVEVIMVKCEGKFLGVIEDFFKSLQRVSNIFVKCFEVLFKVLGMDYVENDEEEILNLVFGEFMFFQVVKLCQEDDEFEIIDDELFEMLEEEVLSEFDVIDDGSEGEDE